jgi:hypothetical protein
MYAAPSDSLFITQAASYASPRPASINRRLSYNLTPTAPPLPQVQGAADPMYGEPSQMDRSRIGGFVSSPRGACTNFYRSHDLHLTPTALTTILYPCGGQAFRTRYPLKSKVIATPFLPTDAADRAGRDCEGCGRRCEAKHTVSLHRAPAVLRLDLRRYVANDCLPF